MLASDAETFRYRHAHAVVDTKGSGGGGERAGAPNQGLDILSGSFFYRLTTPVKTLSSKPYSKEVTKLTKTTFPTRPDIISDSLTVTFTAIIKHKSSSGRNRTLNGLKCKKTHLGPRSSASRPLAYGF